MTDAETILELRAALAAKDQHLQEAQQEVAFLKGVRYTAIIRRAEQAEAQSATQEAQIAHLQDAIRSHRDARGDDRCWMDDEELYKTLPEGYTPPQRDSAVELQMCERFIRSRQHPATVYVSPQRRIEELEAELTAARQSLAVRLLVEQWRKYANDMPTDGHERYTLRVYLECADELAAVLAGGCALPQPCDTEPSNN
jgi:hypothetical protein